MKRIIELTVGLTINKTIDELWKLIERLHQQKEIICFKCGKIGHLWKLCTFRLYCFKCHRNGHWTKDCNIQCNYCGKFGYRENKCYIKKREQRKFMLMNQNKN